MQTNKIEKLIYIGDTHGFKYFKDFINKYNDGKTKFISLGDIFDRGENSYEIIEIIKTLHKEGKFQMVLGNHDLFFIFGKLYNIGVEELNKRFKLDKSNDEYQSLNKLFKIYNDQYFWNGGSETNTSFKTGLNLNSNYDDNLNDEIYNAYCLEIAEFLFKNFDIFHIDELNNISIHGGINILPNGDIVFEKSDGKFIGGIERLQKYNEKLKAFDYEIIKKLTAYFDNYKHQIFIEMKENGFINGKAFHNTDNTDYIPTWMPNYLIDKYEEVRETLIKELDKNGLNRCIMGHYSNEYNKFNETPKNYRYFRIDRNFLGAGNFGVLILDKDGEVLKIDDVSNLI